MSCADLPAVHRVSDRRSEPATVLVCARAGTFDCYGVKFERETACPERCSPARFHDPYGRSPRRCPLTDPRIQTIRRGAAQCCMAAVALTAVASRATAQAPTAASSGARRQQQSIQVTPDNVRLTNYLHDLGVASRGTVVGTIGGGLAGSLLGRSSTWNDGAEGLAREIASREAQVLVTVSVRHGVAALMHRSTGYQPCDCHGFGPRVGHALLETFTDRRADGSRALSVPRFAGAYAGSFARMAWEPGKNAGQVAMGTTVSLGVSALFNVARELTGVGR